MVVEIKNTFPRCACKRSAVVDVVVVNEDASMMTRAVAVEVNWSCAHNVDVGEVDEMVGVK